MITDQPADRSVNEIMVADTAARAARAVPGVARLQPGVLGLVRQLAGQAFERVTGRGVPDIAGVQAELLDDGSVRIDLRIVIDGRYQAAAVGGAVQQAVSTAVPQVGGCAVAAVTVHVVEVELP